MLKLIKLPSVVRKHLEFQESLIALKTIIMVHVKQFWFVVLSITFVRNFYSKRCIILIIIERAFLSFKKSNFWKIILSPTDIMM